MLDCSSPHFALVMAETAVMVSDERGEEEKNLHSQPPKFLCPAHNQKRKWMNSNSVCQKMRITTAQRRRISGQGEKERQNICNGCGYGFPSANLHFDWLAALFSFRFFNSISLASINAHLVHMYTFECVCLVFKFKGDSFVGQPSAGQRELITDRAGGHWLAPETSRWVMRLGATASYTHHTVLSPVCFFPGPRRG